MIAAFMRSMREFFDGMSEREFQRFVAIVSGVTLLAFGLIIFYQYRATSALTYKIGLLNEERDETREILERAQRVSQQQAYANKILRQNEDFKIGGYFKDVLAKLRLAGKQVTETKSTAERADNYREVSLTATFTDMNMREVVELLHELGKTERIYTKELQLTKSKKKPGTLDVSLTIGTIIAKSAERIEE